MKRFIFAMAVFFIFVVVAQAGVTVNMETLSVLTSATKTFTAAQIQDATKQNHYAQRAFCTLSGGQMNFSFDGATTPTTGATGVGHYAQSGDQIVLTGWQDIQNFTAIAATGTVSLTCSYSF